MVLHMLSFPLMTLLPNTAFSRPGYLKRMLRYRVGVRSWLILTGVCAVKVHLSRGRE